MNFPCSLLMVVASGLHFGWASVTPTSLTARCIMVLPTTHCWMGMQTATELFLTECALRLAIQHAAQGAGPWLVSMHSVCQISARLPQDSAWRTVQGM